MATRERKRRPKNLTPETVAEHGWRDERYNGPDQCGRCHGWGTLATLVSDARSTRRVLQTCAKCLGKGHE